LSRAAGRRADRRRPRDDAGRDRAGAPIDARGRHPLSRARRRARAGRHADRAGDPDRDRLRLVAGGDRRGARAARGRATAAHLLRRRGLSARQAGARRLPHGGRAARDRAGSLPGVRGQRGRDHLGADGRNAGGRDLGRQPAVRRGRSSGPAARPPGGAEPGGHRSRVSPPRDDATMIADVQPGPPGVKTIPLAPTLVLLPDPEARARLEVPLLGIPLARRIASSALEAGFAEVVVAPGLAVAPPEAREVPIGDELSGPGLVVFEGTYLDPQLLRLMVEHPLESDERYSLYDGVARPAGFFAGELGAMPAIMPVSEELDWPE